MPHPIPEYPDACAIKKYTTVRKCATLTAGSVVQDARTDVDPHRAANQRSEGEPLGSGGPGSALGVASTGVL